MTDALTELTADIVAAHLSNNAVGIADIGPLIANLYAALVALKTPAEEPAVKQEPAVSVRSSIKPDYIVCLEDGKKLKMLKRHLMTHYQMTPADYRAKWNLPAEYPMVAPNYSETRKVLAQKSGLGRKARPAVEATPAKPARAPRTKNGIVAPAK